MKILWGARTNFSLGESILTVEQLIATAKERGYTHIALADTMSVSALIDATNKAKKAGMEILSGCTLRVRRGEITYYPKVYIMDGDGFVDLLKALSGAERSKDGLYLSQDQFIELVRTRRFVVTLGDALSAVSSAVPDPEAGEIAREVRDACSAAQCAVELVAVATPHFARQNLRALRIATEEGLPAIVTSYSLYANKDDADARDLMYAVAKNLKADSRARNIQASRELFIPTPDELKARMVASMKLGVQIDGAGWKPPQAALLNQALQPDADDPYIAQITYRWSKAAISLPKMADDEFAALRKLCAANWHARLHTEVLGYQPPATLLPEYMTRLKMELDVIQQLGFSNYFLLVADVVRWSKENGIIVGPGRGSVGGSLIAFLIGITDVDPIRFKLLFERFINPERLDLPDADLDFASERRHEVIQYLKRTYGEECVAGISNYNTLGSPAALRAVGSFNMLPEREYACSKYVPKVHGQSKSLDEAAEEVPEIAEFAKRYPEHFESAKRLEGQFRSFGTHAAGVVVAAEPLHTRAVVELRGEDRVVNWDKRVVEDQGLVKMDILGLSNLDILKRAIDKIEYAYGRKIDLLQVPLDDPKTMDAFGKGDTTAVFQFESGGMRKLLKDLRSGGDLTFEDLSAATALYRPGPIDSGLLADYVSVRQGVAGEHYDHPNMERALKDTFGVIVYQEQVMQIARDLAGFTFPEADHLRKAMGKKDAAMMAAQRDKWVEGCERHSGVSKIFADNLFDKIEKFAGYAFNRSHSVEYSVISVWTMWLKQHYPHEFYAACLEVFKEDKLEGVVRDALERGIEILPPDINESTRDFRRKGDHLLAPFSRIKGISESCEGAILEAREQVGRFKDVAHFEASVNKTKCNVRHRANLERVGAYASIIPGSTPARHPDRVKDQRELLPGLVVANVKVDRAIPADGYARQAIERILIDARSVLKGAHPLPRLGRKPRFMVVVDCPSKKEEERGRLLEGDSAAWIRTALDEAGLTLNDIYFTALVKSPKQDKTLSNEEINAHKPFFEREIEALKPPIIVALGSGVSRYLCPDEKGSIMDLAGKVVYDKARDASVVIGINPMMLWHDPSKSDVLAQVFRRAAELLS